MGAPGMMPQGPRPGMPMPMPRPPGMAPQGPGAGGMPIPPPMPAGALSSAPPSGNLPAGAAPPGQPGMFRPPGACAQGHAAIGPQQGVDNVRPAMGTALHTAGLCKLGALTVHWHTPLAAPLTHERVAPPDLVMQSMVNRVGRQRQVTRPPWPA